MWVLEALFSRATKAVQNREVPGAATGLSWPGTAVAGKLQGVLGHGHQVALDLHTPAATPAAAAMAHPGMGLGKAPLGDVLPPPHQPHRPAFIQPWIQ